MVVGDSRHYGERMIRPVLEVLTRAYERPTLLAANQDSLQRQTCHEWAQTLLVDEVGVGIAATYDRLAEYEPTGHWVWLLDDDDLCVYDYLVDTLNVIDCLGFDVVIARMDHRGPSGRGKVLPDAAHWKKPPQQGYIGASAYIVRKDVWMAYRHAFAPGCYESDYQFIRAVYDSKPSIYWLEEVIAKCQKVSNGEPE